MIGSSIVVLTSHRQTRRQIARSLGAGGILTQFVDSSAGVVEALAAKTADLIIIDCDQPDFVRAVEVTLELLNSMPTTPPVVLLSLGADKQPLIELIQRHDIGNLVAKHGAIRAVFPVLDERELLVTCEKVMRRNIFGIDKYVGSWGVVLHRGQITGAGDKTPFLNQFEGYLNDLDCPHSVVPGIVTVAEELIVNAMVHAPRHADGTARYEQIGLVPDLVLEPHEYVQVVYGCDGQRLMLSVTDNFGRLDKKTLYNYLARGFDLAPMEAESKASGAGLGLSLSFRSIHQLIFNIQDSVRTEVIAGWYLRVMTASEFRQVGKSLNLFWLPRDDQQILTSPEGRSPTAATLVGRIDETTRFEAASRTTALDLREVTSITSRGVMEWLKFIRSRGGRELEVRGCPDVMVRLAVEVAGVLDGVAVKTVMAPFECSRCSHEQTLELPPSQVLAVAAARCASCGDRLHFAGVAEHYQIFTQLVLSG